MIPVLNNQVLALLSDGHHHGSVHTRHHERAGGTRRGRRTLQHAVIVKVRYDVVSSIVNGRVSRVGEFREQRPSSPRARHSGAVVGVVVEEAPLHTIVAGVRDDEESFGINGGCSGIQQLCRS